MPSQIKLKISLTLLAKKCTYTLFFCQSTECVNWLPITETCYISWSTV